jgi:Phage tail assembly chaperone protein
MQYGIFVDARTGIPINTIVYKEAEIPAKEYWPLGTTLITFTEDDAVTYAQFVEDPDRTYSPKYLPGKENAKYNFTTNLWEFQLAPVRALIDQVREIRNMLLAASDIHARVPDYPPALQQATLAYRQALRDITTQITPEMTRIEELNWPEPPPHH